MSRLEQITSEGYQVKIEWECEFDESGIVRQKPELLNHPIVRQSPLRTRDVLYGGRTETMRLHYKANDNDETIQYVDVMSLYPYICKYFKFPVGHPVIHMGDACRDTEACLRIECLIKYSIVPPDKLYHPVLPLRCNNKLKFCLCRTCADTSSAECTHSEDEDPALTGTWILDEVRLAVEKGYRILEIYEVYEYQVTQYKRETGEGVLFVNYINTFLKIKAETSGYRSWVGSPEDEERFIDSFKNSEGIRLGRESIKFNAAKRGLDKLCLNSMWGKLTERNDRTKTKIITEPRELYTFLATPDIEVTNLVFASDDVVWLSWKHGAEEDVPSLRHANEVMGAYVTAGARIHLYRYLDRLQEKAIYCDTDSVIYIQPKDEPSLIETGDKVGDMTSELRPSESISEFVSGGPKNYAYKIVTEGKEEEKTVCKVRGITLNYSASKLVNFENIRDMILRTRYDEPPTVVNVHTEKKIKRKRTGGGLVAIVTEPEDKNYRISFYKRQRLDDHTSVPFGYK